MPCRGITVLTGLGNNCYPAAVLNNLKSCGVQISEELSDRHEPGHVIATVADCCAVIHIPLDIHYVRDFIEVPVYWVHGKTSRQNMNTEKLVPCRHLVV